MKKFGNFKLFALVIILTGALVFVGINFLEAKKPDKPEPEPEYTWTVAIPGEDKALDPDYNYNLFGLSNNESNGDFIYEDQGEGDGIYVSVEKKKSGKAAVSLFRLGVFNNIDENGDCVGWGDGPKKIGFQNITAEFLNFAPTVEEEYPCFFPPTYSPYPCDDPDHGIGNVPQCMVNFLTGFLHPYCAGPHPECSYYCVEISIKVDCDFENITQITDTTGIVWIRVINTFDLQSGCEYPHNISGKHSVEVPDGSIKIMKSGDNTWNITVDGTFTFTEIYKSMFRGKGKRWEYKIPYWAQIPLKFETTWTRSKS